MPKDPLGAVSVSELNVGDFQEAIPSIAGYQSSARRGSSGTASSFTAVSALLRARREAEREQRLAEAQRQRDLLALAREQRAEAREQRAEARFQQSQQERAAKKAQEAAQQQILLAPPKFVAGEGFDALPYSEQSRLYEEWLDSTVNALAAANPKAKQSELYALRSKLVEASPPPIQPARSSLDFVADTAGGFVSGATQMIRSTLGLGLDEDNAVMEGLQSIADATQPSSPVEEDRRKQIAFEMQKLQEAYDKKDVSAWRRFFEEAGIQVRNLSAGSVMALAGNVVPSIAVGGGTGLLARGAALRSGALAGQIAAGGAEAANAIRTAGVVGQRAAQATGAALEGASTGGEAGLNTFASVMALDPKVLAETDEWKKLALQLETDDPAVIQKALAQAAATDARWLGGTLGTLLGGLAGVEAMTGRAVRNISARRAAAARISRRARSVGASPRRRRDFRTARPVPALSNAENRTGDNQIFRGDRAAAIPAHSGESRAHQPRGGFGAGDFPFD